MQRKEVIVEDFNYANICWNLARTPSIPNALLAGNLHYPEHGRNSKKISCPISDTYYKREDLADEVGTMVSLGGSHHVLGIC